MKLTRNFTSFALIFSLSLFSFLTLPISTIQAQDARVAVQRGYRTGYSDGYMAGYRDAIDNVAKSYVRHNEYLKADRAYSKDYGLLEDYRDGYQQGFESGYDTGYEKRSFDATIPADLKKRGWINSNVGTAPTTTAEQPVTENAPTYTNTSVQNQPRNEPDTLQVSDDDRIVIGADTELILELIDEVGTDKSREGDRFTARVISPVELTGAIIEGRVRKLQKPGKIKRRAEILLSFDRIVLSEGRWGNFNAILTEVLPVRGDNVRQVDVEGTVEGRSTLKDDGVKVGAATGTGTVIGAIAGGPVGAAVGAGLGAAFGVGAVVMERGKHIKLNKNQQLRIRSSHETQIR